MNGLKASRKFSIFISFDMQGTTKELHFGSNILFVLNLTIMLVLSKPAQLSDAGGLSEALGFLGFIIALRTVRYDVILFFVAGKERMLKNKAERCKQTRADISLGRTCIC